METIEITKKQKTAIESICKQYNLSVPETIEYMLEALEDISDKKLVEEIEAHKKANPNMKYYTEDEADKILNKVWNNEISVDDIK